MATHIVSAIRFRWNSYLRACLLSACQFSWVIKECGLPRSITRLGFGHGRDNWRPMSDALGRPTNRNKGYTAGARTKTPAELRCKQGGTTAGGGWGATPPENRRRPKDYML